MDVSKLTIMSQQLSSLVKAGGDTGAHKPAATRGNSLPALEQRVLTAGSPENNEEPVPRPSAGELRELVAKANESLAVRSSDLKFSVADGTDINVVRIEDSETGELIRQIPSEEMVALARALAEQRQGMMLEERV